MSDVGREVDSGERRIRVDLLAVVHLEEWIIDGQVQELQLIECRHLLANLEHGFPIAILRWWCQSGRRLRFSQASKRWKNTSSANELTASDGAANDDLGVSASVSGPTMLAGAPKS